PAFTQDQVADRFTRQANVAGFASSTVDAQVRAYGAFYTLAAVSSNRCLNVYGVSQDNGANLVQWDCDPGAPHEQFLIEPQDNNRYRIVAAHSGKCVNLLGAGTANGDRFVQWDCITGATNELFTLNAAPTNGAVLTLTAVHSGKCMNVLGAGTANGTQ